MWKGRNILTVCQNYPQTLNCRLVSSSTNPDINKIVRDKLVYSTLKNLMKNIQIEKSREAWLASKKAEIPNAEVLNKVRSKHNFRPSSEEPLVPVALQFLYKGSTSVQGENTNSVSPEPKMRTETHPQKDVFPFALYNDVNFENDASSESPKSVRRIGRRGTRNRVPNSVRNIDIRNIDRNEEYEIITDNLEPESARKLLSQDDMFKYGSADPELLPSTVPCGKCGAHLHCQDSKLPGFLPVEIFRDKTDNQLRRLQCQRCYIMSEYNIALKMNVAPDDYPKTIEHLKDIPAVIVLIVDLLDFPGSVWPNIMELLGRNKRIVLVGNKVDLLPQDSTNYLRRIETSMEKTFMKKCSQSGLGFTPKISSTLLVSARTGYGIENLINKVFAFWKDNEARVGGNVYLIGTTNVGKSSIFNLLLESDLCSIKAIDKVEKALTSPVPGTTLNLLKFPIMRPDPSRLAQRFLRLGRERSVQTEREKVRIEMLRKFKDRRFCSVQGQPIGQTFVQQLDKSIPLRGGGFSIDIKRPIRDQPIRKYFFALTDKTNINLHKARRDIPARLNPEHRDFVNGQWCHDSPGTVSEDQIINLLTQEEVLKTLPQLPILPRSFTVRVGQTIFVAGLARFDVLDGPELINGYKSPLNLTVFTSDDLPINIVRTEDADEFYSQAFGSDLLAVPIGSSDRLQNFPPLAGFELEVDSFGTEESSCDVVLSSAGWISCAPKVSEIFKIKAWTPNGKGIFLREPPFLPRAIQLRGDKVKGTPAFKNNKFFIPNVN